MKILQDLNFTELKNLIESYGEKSFRATQIYSALHNGLKISEISNISKALRERILEEYVDEPVEIVKTLVSKDGTEKYLFKLFDGNITQSKKIDIGYFAQHQTEMLPLGKTPTAFMSSLMPE